MGLLNCGFVGGKSGGYLLHHRGPAVILENYVVAKMYKWGVGKTPLNQPQDGGPSRCED